MRKLRRYLLEGLAVIGPLGLSIWVLVWLFTRLDRILGQYLDPVLGWPAPGLGLLLLVVLLVVTGWVTERTLGARLVRSSEALLARVPVARQVYRGSRRIVRTVLGEDRIAFQEVAVFEWPDEGRWVLGFITGPAPDEVQERLGEEAVTLYMPTAPNPASGYLIMLPRSRLVLLDVSVEEAFTFVLSAGSVPIGQAGELLQGVGPPPGTFPGGAPEAEAGPADRTMRS
ncbi:MAG: DUF502 domain-containing protein [Gemmatimonadota bacterium]|jgi:uncharacterized membrane protein